MPGSLARGIGSQFGLVLPLKEVRCRGADVINFRGSNHERLVAERDGLLLELAPATRLILIGDAASKQLLAIVSFDGMTVIPEVQHAVEQGNVEEGLQQERGDGGEGGQAGE